AHERRQCVTPCPFGTRPGAWPGPGSGTSLQGTTGARPAGRTTTAAARGTLLRVSLIQLNGIVKSYGGRRILDGLDFDVVEGARIGVIGPNGGGKSTLLRILAGIEEADAGHVARRRELTIGWLPQNVEGDSRTPMETVTDARPDLREL